MLYTILGLSQKEIRNETGWTQHAISNAVSRRCDVAYKTTRSKRFTYADGFDLDQIEREYLNGATTYDLGKKYGVNHHTISDWMRKRGICLGKGAHQEGRSGKTKANGKYVYSERMHEINQRKHEDGERRFAMRLEKYFGGRFEYVGGFRDGGRLVATVRCVTCGHEFVHSIDVRTNWQCPKCVEAEQAMRQQESDARRYERMFAKIREYSLDKTCAECGSIFHSTSSSALYCSDKCRNRSRDRNRTRVSNGFRHYYHVKYGDAYREHYDPSVTLNALYERDGGICQICGEPCDWDDKEWGCMGPTYPSIDHIVPRAKGGDHFWSNVQLAHCMCNSRKRDLPDDAIKAEVMLNAS
jgi:5-methylcytosine-specific restriction endonuclease McrA